MRGLSSLSSAQLEQRNKYSSISDFTMGLINTNIEKSTESLPYKYQCNKLLQAKSKSFLAGATTIYLFIMLFIIYTAM